MMDELTAAEVNAAIREHWQTENLVIAMVTGDADGITKALRDGVATPIEYSNPMPAEILAEDAEIAAWPLAVDAIDRIPVGEVFEQ
jgi:zinc protease